MQGDVACMKTALRHQLDKRHAIKVSGIQSTQIYQPANQLCREIFTYSTGSWTPAVRMEVLHEMYQLFWSIRQEELTTKKQVELTKHSIAGRTDGLENSHSGSSLQLAREGAHEFKKHAVIEDVDM